MNRSFTVKILLVSYWAVGLGLAGAFDPRDFNLHVEKVKQFVVNLEIGKEVNN